VIGTPTFTGVGPMLRAISNVAVLSPADSSDTPKDLRNTD